MREKKKRENFAKPPSVSDGKQKKSNVHKTFAIKFTIYFQMPPKKEVAVEKPLLGRFKNSLKCGVVGMPNVGKVKRKKNNTKKKNLFSFPFFFFFSL
jgi:ribosome biogenesis GTPase A